jgi:hypothetical protein
MSEYAQRLCFDSVPQHGMQAGARHHVGSRAEDIADPILDVDQFDQIEARVVRVEEKIDIAVRSSLLAGDGAEQIEPGNADLMKIGFVGAKLRNHIIPLNDKSPEARLARTTTDAALQEREPTQK